MKTCDTAIILAGGKSKRMGFDKQFISVDDMYLIDKIISVLKKEFKQIIIISNTPHIYKDRYEEVYIDSIKNVGPLGGLYTGLSHSKSKYNYLIACDMPCINIDYIRYMKQLLSESDESDAIITRYKNWIEPFNAIYSKSLINELEDYLKTNKRSVNSFLKLVNVKYIDEDIARQYSYNWNMFRNINDLKELKKFCKEGTDYEFSSEYADM
jgi:molybdopterin-guanine dinucleotide biosynthesis protein A